MIDYDRILKMAEHAAKKSGRHLMKNFGQIHLLYNNHNVSGGEYSRFDIESNDTIIKSLLDDWFREFKEEILVISEESRHPTVALRNDSKYICREHIEDLVDWKGFSWVIDPICGSIAYARGIKDFIISIAFLYKNDVLVAAVFDPAHNELFHAIKDKGAYLNGTPIKPSEICALNEAVVSVEHKVYRELPPWEIREIAVSVRRIRTAMTCALEMCYVACGRLDAVIKLDQAFYDFIGGALILKEALGERRGLINIDNGKPVLPVLKLGERVGFVGTNGLISNELINKIKIFKNSIHNTID